MIGNIFRVLISVKAKLFFGFLSMVIIIALLGGFAYMSLGGAGAVVKDTFDRPLMAINFARSAGQVFSELEIEVLEQANQTETGERLTLDNITPFLERFKDDLGIAKERSISARAESFFTDIETELAQWETLIFAANTDLMRANIKTAQTHADAIEEMLDIIVELQTNESFRARERSISQMEQISRYSLGAVGIALAITLILSAWIAVTIIRPLKAAADAARKISAGDFNVDIPKGGEDETGVLLKTMSVMQAQIRRRVDQEQNMRALAQDRLSDSLFNSQDAILLTNDKGLIIVANPQMRHMFPALADVNLIGQPFADYFFDDGRSRRDPCSYREERKEISFDQQRWARVAASDTQEGGRLYIWNDITEAKIRTQRLREAKEEAEAADKAKTQFLAAMSHELRTPLNAVIGFADILKAHHKGPDGNMGHAEMAGLISQSGAQLLNIVKDVLRVAHGQDKDDMPMQMRAVEMADIATYGVKTIAADAQKKDIRVLWTPPAQSPIANGDELRLQQLLLNLLSNAITYNRPGGTVKVQLSTAKDGWTCLDVIDNGIGIPEADLERIMEPFAQVDASNTRKHDGVGLGLTLVKQITNAHGGQVKIRSKLGQGTVASVYLPPLTKPQSSSLMVPSS